MARNRSVIQRWPILMAVAASIGLAGCATPFWEPQPEAAPPEPVTSEALPAPKHAPAQRGIATYYAKSFTNKPMADGTPFNPQSDSAASKSLPLGTKAEVTNLDNGKKAVVTIRDRGPHAKGAIIDVSPKTAETLGMVHRGRARVRVTPLGSGEVKEAQSTP